MEVEMDKRKFCYKLTKILDNYIMFTTPIVNYSNDIIFIKFKRKDSYGIHQITRAYTEEDLISLPSEIIEEELSSNLRKLYDISNK